MESLAIVALASLVSALFVTQAPGFTSDERDLDGRLSARAVEARRSARAEQARVSNVLRVWAGIFVGTATGHLGVSRSLNRPVAEIVRERAPTTALLVLVGGTVAFGAAAFLACVSMRSTHLVNAVAVSVGMLLCVPSGLLGILGVLLGWPVVLPVTVAILPRLLPTCMETLRSCLEADHIRMAVALGVKPWRVITSHALPNAWPQLLAIAGTAYISALGIAIPVETLTGTPGLGQLAWQATLGRDLPLVSTLAATFAVAVRFATSISGGLLVESTH